MRVRLQVIAVFLLVAFGADAAPNSRRFPIGKVGIGYRQSADGEMSETVYQMWLECSAATCSLTVLTLNFCVAGGFYPQVERFTTSSGAMRVAAVSRTSLVVEQRLGDVWGEGFWVHRFEFKSAGTAANPQMRELTAYSGTATKHSRLLGKVISWTAVPLELGSHYIQFDCPAALDAVASPEP